ncbi:site-specific integrase, partial [Oleiphilus sp. HI0061]|uniref:tyrosine-type recombinase/integrase n=1 Tax=Oleiphilus sp. HI0061 TaxID=1822239 RepID=UPI000AB74431
YRYRFHSKPRRMKLGTYPELSLKEARKIHMDMRSLLEKGIDPIDKAKADLQGQKLANTMRQICEIWIDKFAKPKRARWKELDSMLKKNVYEQIGSFKLSDIHRRTVSDLVLDPMLKRGAPVQANRVLTLLKQILNYGVEHGYLEHNPLKELTKKSVGGQEQSRDRTLDDSEIHKFWYCLNRAKMSVHTELALKLLLVTGQRRGEINNARWSHIDLNEKVWTIPKENSKNRKAHRVPLSPLAIKLFSELYALRDESDWVLPSFSGNDAPMTERVISRAANRAQEVVGIDKWVPHDLRRTAATKMAGIGVAIHVVEKILNHTMGGVMEVYNRYDYWEERVEALDRWAEEVEGIIEKRSS